MCTLQQCQDPNGNSLKTAQSHPVVFPTAFPLACFPLFFRFWGRATWPCFQPRKSIYLKNLPQAEYNKPKVEQGENLGLETRYQRSAHQVHCFGLSMVLSFKVKLLFGLAGEVYLPLTLQILEPFSFVVFKTI